MKMHTEQMSRGHPRTRDDLTFPHQHNCPYSCTATSLSIFMNNSSGATVPLNCRDYREVPVPICS